MSKTAPNNEAVGRQWDFALRLAAVFVPLLIYVGAVLDPRLLYHNNPRPFLVDWEFLQRQLSYASGPAEYVNMLMVQSYLYRSAGAAVFVVLAAGMCLATRGVFTRLAGGRPSNLAPLVPPVLLVMAQSRFRPTVPLAGLVVALVFSYGYLKLPWRQGVLRAAVFAAAGAVLYYLVGGPFLVFVALGVIYETLAARRWMLGLACLGLSGLGPYLISQALYTPNVDMMFLYTGDLVGPRGLIPILGVYAFLGGAAANLALGDPLGRLVRRIAGPALEARVRGFPGRPAGRATATVSVAAGAVLAVALAFDGAGKGSIQLSYLTANGQWEEALKVAARLPADTLFSRFNQNRALYHAGRMAEDMFSWPQRAGGEDLLLESPDMDDKAFVQISRSDVYLDLGRVNEAERQTSECLATKGACPHTLKRMALINVLQDRPQAARQFLGAMGNTLFDRAWARQALRRLEADPTMAGDPEVRRIRLLMLKKDYPGTAGTERILKQSLEANPRNRMAFEYLMAYYLLTGQLQNFMANVDRIGLFDDPRLPRHYEEVILAYAYESLRPVPETMARQIRPETIRRFGAFMKAMNPFAEDVKAAQQAMAKDYGDTYWYFLAFKRTASAAP